MEKRGKFFGLFLVIVGCLSWGASGTIADYMFLTQHVSVIWVVGVRMITAGILLLLIFKMTDKKKTPIWVVWKDWKLVIVLLCFSIFGMLMSQICYLSAVNYGNAATATVLQFTAPVFIIFFFVVSRHKLPNRIDSISVIIAIIGTYLLATKGEFDSLSISALGLVFGIGAGIASANCTLIPIKLLKEYDSKLVCGWAMLIGSIPLIPNLIINTKKVSFSPILVFELVFIIIFGTMIAYLFYVASLNYLKPGVTGMLGSFEPLTATVLSIMFLHLKLNLVEIIGGVLILAMAFIQALPHKNKLE